MDTQKIILVVGATGKQGGAVVRHLLEAGFRVRAMTRNPNSDAAKTLATLGAQPVKANLNEPNTLGAALAGAHGVFSVQNYWEKGVGYSGEVRQGKALAGAAKKAGVKHFVQSTMAAASSFEGVEHFASKKAVEDCIRTLELPYTFVGTVYFMDNVLDPKMGGGMTFPTLAGTLGKHTPFQLLAVDDIGAVVAEVFKQPERFVGERVDLAGDKLTVAEMKTVYHSVTGQRPKPYSIPGWFLRFLNGEFAAQLKWHKQVGWQFGPEVARTIYPSMTSFETFLKRHNVTGL